MAHLFKCDLGNLECVPVDMKEVRRETAEWEATHPAPVVPVISFKTFEAVTSGRSGDMLPNPDDPAYKKQLSDWQWQQRQFMEGKMFLRSVQLPTAAEWGMLARIMTDIRPNSQRFELFRFIISISEVTEEAVKEAGKRFRLYVERTAVARLAYQRGQGASANGRNGLSGSGRTVQLACLEGGQINYSATGRISCTA